MFQRLPKRIFQNNILKVNSCNCSTAATETKSRNDVFRTNENNPLNHTWDHVAKFYRVDPEVKKRLFAHGGLPKSFETQVKTFTETCIMVRKPAVDVIACLNAVDYKSPVLRFVLYGAPGTGKSLSLAHVLHYGHEKGLLLVHVPWLGNWMRRCKEYSNSSTREGYVDLPLDAAAWLIHFKNQNQQLLSNNDALKLSRDYAWSKRELTQKGAPLLELIEHGINRVKYANDCVVALAEEIKQLSTAGVCKTLVAIDGFNAFFYPHIRVYTEKKEAVPPSKVTLTEAFLNLTRTDWCNGVAVLTVDELAIAEQDQQSHHPLYLLGREGFAHLDPFIPIPVDTYDEKELSSCMDYFRERRWIHTDSNYDQELAAISFYNPYRLMLTCAPL